jgi:hypothetical protein
MAVPVLMSHRAICSAQIDHLSAVSGSGHESR